MEKKKDPVDLRAQQESILDYSEFTGKHDTTNMTYDSLRATATSHIKNLIENIYLDYVIAKITHFEKEFKNLENEIIQAEKEDHAEGEESINEDTRWKFVKMVHDFFLKITEDFFNKIKKYEELEHTKTWKKDVLLFKKKVGAYGSNVDTIIEFMEFILITDDNDLFLKDIDSPEWKEIFAVTEIVQVNDNATCIKSYEKIGAVVQGFLGSCAKAAKRIPKTSEQLDAYMNVLSKDRGNNSLLNHDNPIEIFEKVDLKAREKCDSLGIKLLIRIKHYEKNPEKRYDDVHFFIANPQYSLLVKTFNFTGKGTIKFFRKKLEYKSIVSNLKLYIQTDSFSRFLDTPEKNNPVLIKKGSDKNATLEEILQTDLFKKDKVNKIMVRVLIDNKMEGYPNRFKSIYEKFVNHQKNPKSPAIDPKLIPVLSEEEKKYFETTMIFIHGGGFVAMETSTHLNFLIPWVKDLHLPIFGIDYRTAPRVAFPELPNDGIRAYIWILEFLKKILGVELKRLIIAGDSAGGNLVLMITNWCIENNYRKPDYIQAHYPASFTYKKYFRPSFLYSFEDFMLNLAGIKMCLKSYVGEGGEETKSNYYLSPVIAPISILKEYPKTDVFVVERDPLQCDGIRMIQRLLKAKPENEPRGIFFKSLAHGQLNFATKNGMPEGYEYEKVARRYLQEYLGQQTK